MSKGHVLSAAEILAVKDIELKKIYVPEWGGEVFIKVFNGIERDAFDAAMAGFRERAKAEGKSKDEAAAAWAALLLLHTLVDADGNRLFATDESLEALRLKNAAVLERLSISSMQANGYLANAHEQAVKNSEADQNADSGSSSQE